MSAWWNDDIREVLDSSSLVAEPSVEPRPNGKMTQKQRRHWYYRQANPFRKIPKSDLRRQFSQMWLNVWNWQSPLEYRGFLHHFYSKHVVAQFEYEPGVEAMVIKHFPYSIGVSSVDHSIQNFAYISSIFVDAVAQMHSCTIKRCKNTPGTQVFMQVSLGGTLFYDLHPPNGAMPIDPKELHQYRVPAARPMRIDSLGVLVFDIDEFSHYITKAVYRGCSFQATPLVK